MQHQNNAGTWVREAARVEAPYALLSGAELLMLQLWGRGYSLNQVAHLFALRDGEPDTGSRVDTADALEVLRCASRALGCATSAEAVDEAQRRRLIL